MRTALGVRAYCIAVLAIAAVGCSSTAQVASKFCASQLVTASQGGTVTAEDCATLAGASVAIAPDALAQDTLITLAAGSTTLAPSWATSVGPVVDFGPSGTHFGSQATLTLPFNASRVPEPYRLVVQALEANGTSHRVEHSDLAIDLTAGTVSFLVFDFTQFEVEIDDSPCSRCPPTYICHPVTGACVCDLGLQACVPGGVCNDLAHDNTNCGACGNVCDPSLVCQPGVSGTRAHCGCADSALSSCPSPDAGVLHCSDLTRDPANCGSCGNVCDTRYRCAQGGGDAGGQCVCGATLCRDFAGGPDYCTDLTTDLSNCGACHNACGPGFECGPDVNDAGTCICHGHSCADSSGAQSCVDLLHDVYNCGACGHYCGAGYTCLPGGRGTGECVCDAAICPIGPGTSFCTDLTRDTYNCGACGARCSGGYGCTPGADGLGHCACNSFCGSQCADLQSDLNNCGTCGTVCTGTNPVCCFTENGYFPHCADLDSNHNNCGECERACVPGAWCDHGKCCRKGQISCPSPDGGRRFCIDAASDPHHCGSCTNDCGSQTCVDGGCS